MKDVIDILLKKQETLEADREAEKTLACEKIDAEYADRAKKITALLDMAGYVPEVEEVAEAVADTATEAPAQAEAENGEQASTLTVY